MMDAIQFESEKRYFRYALGLALFTILYNLGEGILASLLGYQDESLALMGFGADSFIEVISGLGIIYMVLRIQQKPASPKSRFERRALQITGLAFYTLVAVLIITSIINIVTGHKPHTTIWGVVISLISIVIMLVLVYLKRNVGRRLASEPIVADAQCTLVCVYMSIILLISSGLYELFNLGYIDSIGTLGLAFFAFREGRECFQKANSEKYCNCD